MRALQGSSKNMEEAACATEPEAEDIHGLPLHLLWSSKNRHSHQHHHHHHHHHHHQQQQQQHQQQHHQQQQRYAGCYQNNHLWWRRKKKPKDLDPSNHHLVAEILPPPPPSLSLLSMKKVESYIQRRRMQKQLGIRSWRDGAAPLPDPGLMHSSIHGFDLRQRINILNRSNAAGGEASHHPRDRYRRDNDLRFRCAGSNERSSKICNASGGGGGGGIAAADQSEGIEQIEYSRYVEVYKQDSHGDDDDNDDNNNNNNNKEEEEEEEEDDDDDHHDGDINGLAFMESSESVASQIDRAWKTMGMKEDQGEEWRKEPTSLASSSSSPCSLSSSSSPPPPPPSSSSLSSSSSTVVGKSSVRRMKYKVIIGDATTATTTGERVESGKDRNLPSNSSTVMIKHEVGMEKQQQQSVGEAWSVRITRAREHS